MLMAGCQFICTLKLPGTSPTTVYTTEYEITDKLFHSAKIIRNSVVYLGCRFLISCKSQSKISYRLHVGGVRKWSRKKKKKKTAFSPE